MRMIINSIYRILHSARMADSLVLVQETGYIPMSQCGCGPSRLSGADLQLQSVLTVPPKRKLITQGISEQWYSTEDSTGSLRTPITHCGWALFPASPDTGLHHCCSSLITTSSRFNIVIKEVKGSHTEYPYQTEGFPNWEQEKKKKKER